MSDEGFDGLCIAGGRVFGGSAPVLQFREVADNGAPGRPRQVGELQDGGRRSSAEKMVKSLENRKKFVLLHSQISTVW